MEKESNALNLSTVSAGLISAIIGYSTSSILVFQAALKLGLPTNIASSWLGVICIAMGLLSTYFSFKTKIPIMFAWSTAGAALLISSFQTPQNINDTYGSFLISGALVTIVGFSGLFEKMMNKIPLSLAKAMLSGILVKFAFNVFTTIDSALNLTLILFITYILLKKFIPRYSIIILSILGFIICHFLGMVNVASIDTDFATPVFYAPTFSIQNIFSIAIPLFIVVMTSQNMAGTAVLHAHDYHVNTSKIIGVSGLAYMLIAPFGGFSLNLSAITAAICMGPEAHEDKNKRYMAGVVLGIFYIFVGIFAGIIGQFFMSLPKELIAIITGLALFGTITSGLEGAFKRHNEADSAMITFFITASGISMFGIGSAFWGIIGGSLNYLITHFKMSDK